MKSLVLAMFLLALSAAPNQPPTESKGIPKQQPSIKIGEVTGNNVYVRSGPSTNYYPVMRLNMGARVEMVANRPAWIGISPPKGAYSLVAKEYVDPDGDDAGVINGNRVWVRAGSDLSSDSYAKQTRLNKGASVKIIGETAEHYKIVPPKGATLWISEDYVKVIEGQVVENVDEELMRKPTEEAAQSAPPPPSIEGIEVDRIEKQLGQIEAALQKEFEKEIFQRDLQSMIDRFGPIARQDEDPVAKHHAQYRIRQLARTIGHIESLKKIGALSARVREDRNRFLQERSKIRPQPLRLTREFAVRGKFVTSAAYSSLVGPQRYRIVDPDSEGMIPKTIAYVEIDPQSNIDPEAFLGRYVGVRARSKHLLEGSVDPMVVYTAAEIAILEELPADEPQE